MIDRETFLAQRRNGIGGSDAAAACGMSPWMTPLALYQQKTGEAPPHEINEDLAYFGHALEPIVGRAFVERTGLEIVEFSPPQIRSAVYPWMTVNLDGRGADFVFEAKTARSAQGWGDQGTDEIPTAYLFQVTHAMVVAELRRAWVAVLIAGSEFRTYCLELDDELAQLVIESERRFWSHVERRDPPEPSNLADVNLRWRRSVPRVVELGPNVAAACLRLQEIRAQVKDLEAEAEQCEALVKMEMREADVATIDGAEVATWKQAKPSTKFDAKAFRAAHPDIAAKFERVEPGSRRFILKKEL